MRVGQQHARQQVLAESLLGLCPRQRVEPEQGAMQEQEGGPAGQQAQYVAQLAHRLDAVQAAASQRQDQIVRTSAP